MQTVKRNTRHFPENFMFQLTKEEWQNNLKHQIVTLSSRQILMSKKSTSSWGGTRKLPYAFTEQGIYMLMTVLKGDLATKQSIALIDAFKQMKKNRA